MSLVKKPTMTERKAAANQQNGSISQRATTEEGKARIAVAAKLRHGIYVKSPEVARRLLGEGSEEGQGGHDMHEKKDS